MALIHINGIGPNQLHSKRNFGNVEKIKRINEKPSAITEGFSGKKFSDSVQTKSGDDETTPVIIPDAPNLYKQRSASMSKKSIPNEYKNYSMIPNIIFDIGLTSIEISIYMCIKKFTGENRKCTKSYNTLAEMSGVSKATLKRYIERLSLINPKLKKPLIIIENRNTECGDQDTNEITVQDIWDENNKKIKEKIGELTQNPPGLTQNPPGLTQNPPGLTQSSGGLTLTPHIEQNHYNNIYNTNTTTTTTTSSKESVIVDKSKSSSSSFLEFENSIKDAASSLIKFCEGRAERYQEKWNLSQIDIEKLMRNHSIKYVTENFNYTLDRQEKYQKNKNRPGNKHKPIDDARTYLSIACEKNYAKSEK